MSWNGRKKCRKKEEPPETHEEEIAPPPRNGKSTKQSTFRESPPGTDLKGFEV